MIIRVPSRDHCLVHRCRMHCRYAADDAAWLVRTLTSHDEHRPIQSRSLYILIVVLAIY